MRKILASFVIGGLLACGVTTTASANDLGLGDDQFAFVPLDFTFNFYGVDYTGIWVNRYGNVTFDSSDTHFTENLPEFLNEQPRIAPAWDDWYPQGGGAVLAKGDANSMVVTWDGVEHYDCACGPNTFSTTLYANGNIDITIDSITTGDGVIVGLSPGGGLGSPGTAVDFSENLIQPLPGLGDQAVYEFFVLFSPDLNGMTISFVPAPGSLALLGLSGLFVRRRRRR